MFFILCAWCSAFVIVERGHAAGAAAAPTPAMLRGAPTPTVALLMADHRSPVALAKAGARGNNLTVAMAAYLNVAYCRRQRYLCILYTYRRADGCAHSQWGHRHPSYCKLTAVAHALNEVATSDVRAAVLQPSIQHLVFLDSDCFVRDVSLSLPSMLQLYQPTVANGAGGRARAEAAPVASFAWDTPYSLGPNGGFFVLHTANGGRESRAKARLHDFLRFWWNVESGRFGLEHSYEQHTLQWQVMHVMHQQVQTLRLRAMEPNTTDPIVHLDQNVGTKQRHFVI